MIIKYVGFELIIWNHKYSSHCKIIKFAGFELIIYTINLDGGKVFGLSTK